MIHKSETKSNGCNKMIFYYWKNQMTGLYSKMPSHKCGEEGKILCDECKDGIK